MLEALSKQPDTTSVYDAIFAWYAIDVTRPHVPLYGVAMDLLGRWRELPTRDPSLFRALLCSCGSAALSRYDATVSPS